MTFPRLRALNARWRSVPPAALQLARIATALGLKPSAPPPAETQTPKDFMDAARSTGMPIFEGKPNDPMLDFLDP